MYVSKNITANLALKELTWKARELSFTTAMYMFKIQT